MSTILGERTRLLPVKSDGTHHRKNKGDLIQCSPYRCLIIISIAATILMLIIVSLQPLAIQHDGNDDDIMGGALLSSSMMAPSNAIRRHENILIRPGSIFLDTNGNPINAHGGGFLFHNSTYYWYGEIKSGKTYLPKANANWGGTRVDLVGISCYSSKDLLNWDYHGNVLPAVRNNDTSHDLYYRTHVMERPKVVYNAKTGKFVMWLHVDSMDYKMARCGVAVSDYPTGPFEYIGSFRPNVGQMARDLTVFADDDGIAYLFTSSEDNAALHVSRLSDDYLSTTGNYTRIFVGRYMEAPTVFKRDGMYYMIMSGCTAWEPNAARSAVATSILGPWKELGNPCRGKGAKTTFHSQSTFVLPLAGIGAEEGGDDRNNHRRFIFAADRWNKNNLSDSRYVWLPLAFDAKNGNPILEWHDEWGPLSTDAWFT